MNLSHPKTNASSSLWENCLLLNGSLMPRRLAIAALYHWRSQNSCFCFFSDPRELWLVKLLDTLWEMSGMFSQWLLLADLIFACSRNNNCGHANILSQNEETAGRVRGKCILTRFLWLILFMWPVENLNLISVRWLRKFQRQERAPGDDAICRALQWCLWSGPSLISVTCCWEMSVYQLHKLSGSEAVEDGSRSRYPSGIWKSNSNVQFRDNYSAPNGSSFYLTAWQ